VCVCVCRQGCIASAHKAHSCWCCCPLLAACWRLHDTPTTGDDTRAGRRNSLPRPAFIACGVTVCVCVDWGPCMVNALTGCVFDHTAARWLGVDPAVHVSHHPHPSPQDTGTGTKGTSTHAAPRCQTQLVRLQPQHTRRQRGWLWPSGPRSTSKPCCCHHGSCKQACMWPGAAHHTAR
jgi:hypothetical protein